MLVEISEDFEEHGSLNVDRHLACVHTLLELSRKGKHFVFAHKSTLRLLSTHPSVYKLAQQTANRLLTRHPELAILQRSIKEKVIVSAKATGISANQNSTWTIGSDVVANANLGSSSLVAEDADDAWIYEMSGKHFIASKNFSGVSMAFSLVGGGGNSTSDQFSAILNERERFCLCITDSDRTAPSERPKETASRCKAVAQSSSWPARHLVLDCKELENLIPLSWYSECAPKDSLDRLSAIREICDSMGVDYVHFSDFKEGVKFRDIKKLAKDSPSFIFWSRFIEGTVPLYGGRCDCGSVVTGNPELMSNCECFVIPPLGRNALRWLVEKWKVDGHPQRLLKVAKKDSSLPAWMKIGERVFEWGVALPPMRI